MTTQSGTGAGTLPHDGKWGNIWNSLVAAGIGAATVWLSDIDWSSWPAWVGTLGGPAAALLVGLLTTKALPRYKR